MPLRTVKWADKCMTSSSQNGHSKVVGWWILIIPLVPTQPLSIFAMAVWTGMYYLRSMTEEWHLSQDPDYQAYREQVRYKFIPGLH